MEDMNASELLVEKTTEATLYKVLVILSECSEISEAEDKIRALLSK